MQVVYEESLSDKIIKAKVQALVNNNTIEFIMLTEAEAKACTRELYAPTTVEQLHNSYCFGVRIKVDSMLSKEEWKRCSF